jgi:cellulose synthase/poly-beta-1,6-N-acetylglucosamine synthase-like glycosyltransferase
MPPSPDDRSRPPSQTSSARATGWSNLDARRQKTRQVIASVALVLGAAYLVWRAVFTLNPDALLFSWFLWLLEAHAIVGVGLAAFSLWDTRPARPAVEGMPDARVAVLITTYDEPVEVVLPTVAAAVAMEGEHETWLLDDGMRPEMRELAERLGADYLGRESSEHAKAGNLNHAIEHLDVDLVAILDADHVPDAEFLRRTLPYFNDPKLALVQTPQDFYNEDSFEHVDDRASAGRRGDTPYTEQSLFYQVIQPGKNRWESAFWCGTNAIVRVEALDEVGGVAVDSITEDLQTTIRLHRAGWRTVYHDEVLARGLAAPTAEEYQLQRRRWCVGAIQTLRQERPFTRSGLTWQQRLSYAGTLLAWFEAFRVVGLLMVPPLVLLTGAAPIAAPLGLFLPVFITVIMTQLVAVRLLGQGHLHPIRSAVFDLVRTPVALMGIIGALTGVKLEFQVTPKGRSEARRIRVPRLLVGFAVLHAVAIGWYVATLAGLTGTTYDVAGVVHGAAFWAVFNGWLLVAAMHRIRTRRYASERRRSHRHGVSLPASLGGQPARLVDVSLTGARLRLRAGHEAGLGDHVLLELHHPEAGIVELAGTVVARRSGGDARPEVHIDLLPGQFEERAMATAGLFTTDSRPRTLPHLLDRGGAPKELVQDEEDAVR